MANVLWIGSTGDPYMDSNSAYLRPVSRVPNPANTVLFEENCGRYSHWFDPQPARCAGRVQGVVRGWHGRDWTFSVSFADGHSSMVKMLGNSSPTLTRYPYCGQDPTQNYCPGAWECVVSRGEGWQKDTLPSPPVPTEVPAP